MQPKQGGNWHKIGDSYYYNDYSQEPNKQVGQNKRLGWLF